MSSVSKNWSESRQYCKDRGADLVIIKTEVKQHFITSLINVDRERVWIGLTDINQEGTMQWVDNSTLEKGFWQATEPNNDRGNEDCVELASSLPPLNNWNDLPCSINLKAICEK
ncbi:C-type lectin domain family 4 member M-like [Labeo rohita]|uniref:C-type lectin domain family 4 member M-like n=1 Tax=Labeo rohita TaxID=84645 RepID=UPI0021E27E9E|nr:C-type lectin domain family 4 member M-like [Labeo rohita]